MEFLKKLIFLMKVHKFFDELTFGDVGSSPLNISYFNISPFNVIIC